MKRFLLASLLVPTVALGAPAVRVQYGEARDLQGNFAYREKHTIRYDGDRVLGSDTIYTDANGKQIARMTSDYSLSVAMPTYVFTDDVRGNREGLRIENGKYVIFTQKRGENEETAELEDTDNVFSCQGWHYYLVNRLSRLEREEIVLNLILPSELRAYGFEVQQTVARGDRVEVRLELDNWLLAVFAPSLKLVYDKSNRRLIEYEGLSNIPDSRGDRQDVRITYEYDEG
ncbi:MAG: hypothetical protein QNK03_22525 [Myxococcota bacterium]|nr:hypothetical protein [Myxococcota bacterium]